MRRIPGYVWIALAITVAWELVYAFGFEQECWDCGPGGAYQSHRIWEPIWVALLGPVLGAVLTVPIVTII
jgi:hypothetical protein